MQYVTMALVGLVVGALAKFILPGKQGGGIIMTSILGIIGALVAGFVGQAIGWYQPGQGAGFIASVVGAIVVLLIYGAVMKKSS